MAIVVVGGSAKDVGKTGLVCAIISALRDFQWTAVKITGHDYAASLSPDNKVHTPAEIIQEETRAGQGTDTARYLAAGARRALLVSRRGDKIPIEEIRAAIGADRNLIFESNRIVEELKPDVCLALVGGDEKKASFEQLFRITDAVVSVGNKDGHFVGEVPHGFQLASIDRLPIDMVQWMREQLSRDRGSLYRSKK
ncbi:MAG TPA: hypothetical protein VN670_07225 [Acidobacteriaceae bacterium]|nr:hypothetical protein [Acidobacteriaceae bacterium]HXS78427.1 hypothetical protein [Terracidiphilus sp.]